MTLKELLPIIPTYLRFFIHEYDATSNKLIVAYGVDTKDDLKNNSIYLDFEVFELEIMPFFGDIILKVKKPTCSSYRESFKEVKLTDFERGVYFGKYGKESTDVVKKVKVCRCIGVKTPVECNCGGDLSKCERKQLKV